MKAEEPGAGTRAAAAAGDAAAGGAHAEAAGLPTPVLGLGALVALLNLYLNLFATLPELWSSALHFGSFALLAALIHPLARGPRERRRPLPFAIDLVLGGLAMASAVYLIFAEDALYARGVRFSPADWLVSAAAILLALEFARRSTGWVVPALVIIGLTYITLWGNFLGGLFHFPGLSWETMLFRGFFSGEGMFGPIARISATYVFMFILFGAFLVRSGAGDFVVSLARALAGRFVGGPGLVAVVASGLTGMISGSAVANTVSTGVITIPLMRRSGFTPRFAAGVEAAASTGGQLMPPIMGAGAFVMASYTQIPYLDIVAAAFLPALMYFLSVAFWVRIEAKRLGIRPPKEKLPGFASLMRGGGLVFLISIGVLIGLLVAGFTPTFAAGFGILAVIAASWLSRRPMGPKAIVEALALGARNMTAIAMLLIAVGLVVNVVTTTGLGNSLALMVTEWAGGSLLLAILFVALASLLLGMGLPVTAAYIVLATLAAPALFDLIARAELVDALAGGTLAEGGAQLLALFAPDVDLSGALEREQALALAARIPGEHLHQLVEQALPAAVVTATLLSAHMIIFWLSQDSNVTPPVCLVAFAAAGIAGTRAMATGFTSWRIAKALYIIPVLFAFTPLIGGEPIEALRVFLLGSLGIYGLSAAFAGHGEAPLRAPARLLYGGAGIALLWPEPLALNLAGAAVALVLIAYDWRRSRPQKDVL
ncbi:MAG: TRAP transporter fused permease subunit [Alphaproteobacteria bacterium]